MKYAILQQIANYLSRFKRIKTIKRVADQAIEIEFSSGDGDLRLIFDLDRQSSVIYINPNKTSIKEYKAPFDTILKKRLNSSNITQILCQENNRILEIHSIFKGSYKELKSVLYLEFTGRFTNAILTDENGVVLEALHHSQNRGIKPSQKLVLLTPLPLKEKDSPKIDDFIEYFNSEYERINEARLSNLKAQKLINIDKKMQNLNALLSSLLEPEELESRADKLAQNASLITANLYKIKDYERDLCLISGDGDELKIKLDEPAKFAANKMFKEAKKLRQKAANIELQKENLLEKISFLDGLKRLINSAKTSEEIEVLAPKKRGQKEIKKMSDLTQDFYMQNCKISVGKSAKGNEYLLKESKKDDLWFHLKDRPSAHVIIKTPKQNISEAVLMFAAKLCVSFSAVNEGEVDYTKRAKIRSQGGSNVLYNDYKTIFIKL